MKLLCFICVVFIGVISIAQNDSIYNRYTNKLRLESFSIIHVYVGFNNEADKDIFSWNGTFSYRMHLVEIGHLEIAFKNGRSQSANNAFTQNTYNLFHISYGYASVFSEKWRMHNTVGLGQIRIEKNRNGSVFKDSKSINLRLGSTLFYDIGKQFAAGAALGYNLNNLKPIPEAGLAITYKPFTKAELDNIKEERRFKKRVRDSIKVLDLKKGEKATIQFHSLQVGLGFSLTNYRSRVRNYFMEDDVESNSFTAGYVETSLTIRYRNHLLGINSRASIRWALFKRPANFSDVSLLYGRLFELSDDVEIEAFSGISSFRISNLGRDDINLTEVGVPFKVNILFSKGSNRFGLTAQVNFNTLAFNHSTGLHYSRRF